MQQNSDITIAPVLTPLDPHAPAAATGGIPADIYTEPAAIDPDTLANLGPLRAPRRCLTLSRRWSRETLTVIRCRHAAPEQGRVLSRASRSSMSEMHLGHG